MKVNTKRLTLWLLVLIIWCGVFTVAGYAIGQHYGKNVAPQQFESDTTAYKELRTQRAVENGVNLVGIAGVFSSFSWQVSSSSSPKKKNKFKINV